MAKRLRPLLGGLFIVTLGVPWLLQLQADSTKTPAKSSAKAIAAFALPDAAGRAVSLDDFKDKKAVVVVFLGTECPLNNQYLGRLAQLHKEFADKGVQFVAVNSNVQDTPERIAAHTKKHEIPFPVLRDDANKVADQFGAKRTPEAFVLDDKHTIRYQGRIDDQYGIDYQRPAPTRRDLAEALSDVLAGQAVRVATTPVAGCLIGRAPKTRADGEITFSKHIMAIVQNKCQECHRAGQIGPMALKTYDDVTSWADMIREVITEKRMPPWYADPAHGKFSN